MDHPFFKGVTFTDALIDMDSILKPPKSLFDHGGDKFDIQQKLDIQHDMEKAVEEDEDNEFRNFDSTVYATLAKLTKEAALR